MNSPGLTLEEAATRVGAGWRSLLERVWAARERAGLDDALPITTVKEKHGGLRVYAGAARRLPDDDALEAFRDAVRVSERASLRTCEACGRPGEPCGRIWVKTLCGWHGHLYAIEGVRTTGFTPAPVQLEWARTIGDEERYVQREAAWVAGQVRREMVAGLEPAMGAVIEAAATTYLQAVRAGQQDEAAAAALAAASPATFLAACRRAERDRDPGRAGSLVRGPLRVHPRISVATLPVSVLAPLLEHDAATVRREALGLLSRAGQRQRALPLQRPPV